MTKAEELVRQGYAAYAQRDFAAVFALFDPEIEIVQTMELPWGGHYRGPDGARSFFTKLAAEVDAQPAPDYYVSAGNDVVAVGRLRGAARKSGKPIDLPIVHVWTTEGDRITKFAAFIDTPAMLKALSPADSLQ